MKNAIRNQMREQRQTLSPALHAEKSKEIRHRLEGFPAFKTAGKMLIYVSAKEEVDTHGLIKDALKQGRKVYVPKIQNGSIAICPLYEWKDLEPGTFGILEPCEILEETRPEEMDIIIVPGLAFDVHGHRVGYGKGYYDKLLKRTRGYKVGLAFCEQMIEKVPTETHDVPLDLIITDKALITP
ncbi:MAG: 5-formyltetrahydrofolate cyclo-ligase [Candidatus Gracilibacteria bacterium]